MTENLLSTEEIAQVLLEAQNPEYSDPLLLHLESKKTSIRNVYGRLILVHGNHSTGYRHIADRHTLTSRIPYWDSEGKLDNPSRFPLGMTSFQFVQAASQIFKEENKNELKNKRPELFDCYIGNFKYHDGPELQCTLLTYTQTGIIHSFFISNNRKPFNKKKVLDLRQGWITTATHDLVRCIKTFEMPYFDRQNVEVFKVIIRNLEVDGIARWYIQVNAPGGQPLLTTFIKEEKIKGDRRMPIKPDAY